jgi:2-polyprenyl-3-methyl-5-hydroxy-6-metoxy-1,4-benzoquinol methylase
MTRTASVLPSAPRAPWPKEGLEAVPVCPVCGAADRALLHGGLRDRVFFCAPGEWSLHQCAGCGAGYLDPRPTRESVGLAYSEYFTHGSPNAITLQPRSAWRRYRTAQRNAYLNARYGYQLAPATARSPRWLTTGRRQRFDRFVGCLPFPGSGARLLDLGCGSGTFLAQMRAVGWEVWGLEPDAKAAAAATAAGLRVQVGLLETTPQPEASFDAITLNHVIEHLHDPLTTLRLCWRALKPGGVLFIACPNLGALGHRWFGADYFPLDPPRHLILFTLPCLRRALQAAGFQVEPSRAPQLVAREILLRSQHVRRGSDPMRRKPRLSLPERLKVLWLARCADRATLAEPELAEELVVLSQRPASGAR